MKTKSPTHSFLLLSLSLALLWTGWVQPVSASTLAVDPITGTNPGFQSPFLGGDATVDPLVSFAGIERGAGVTGNIANNRYNARGWQELNVTSAISGNDYFTWQLDVAEPGLVFEFTEGSGEFLWAWQVSGEGPTNWELRTDLDGFASALAAGTMPGGGGGGGNGLASYTFGGPLFENQVSAPVEFRLYAWGAASGSGTFSVNNYSIGGLVTPEPGRVLLLAPAFALLVLQRRRSGA